ncbi:meiosis initiator protein [Orycteropus afer afer]|uniref:Meiosis initiator protein n=1 Tax=Orycteropus afer afer TaxID=1230840 RepID=A0AC54ZB84_ORYAF|nr:meiosis initiator protein [Orycteropus afer afer]
MWASSKDVYSSEWSEASSLSPGDSTGPGKEELLSSNRKQRKSHTSKLQELALLLPVPLKTGNKKLTKKEILLHVLQYIQYLQRHVDVTTALLKLHITDQEGGLAGPSEDPAGGPESQRHSTPSSSPCSQKSCLQGACQKPRKKKQVQKSEHQTRAQKPRRCLAFNKLEKVTPHPDQRGRNTTPGRQPGAAASSPRGRKKGGRAKPTALDTAEPSGRGTLSSCCCGNECCIARGVQNNAERILFLQRTQPRPRQTLVVYDSNEEVDKESPSADPWLLPAWSVEGSPYGSPLASGPPQARNWSATAYPEEVLGLSPSLFHSPGRLQPKEILEDGTESLTQALFEEAYLGPESPENKDTPAEVPGDPTEAHSLCQSSISLDHCYLSLSETSKAPSSPDSETTKTESLWTQQEDAQADPEDPEDAQSSSEEDDDYTWTPAQQALALPPSGRKAKKGRAGRGPVKTKESKKSPGPTHVKKKCINGFIMFCRMNRKQYIRACPGTASTAATKELAQLWRVMTQQERKPYCVKARRFSRQHNRIVKKERSSSEEDDCDPPKPFYQLLADRALWVLEPPEPEPAPRAPSSAPLRAGGP